MRIADESGWQKSSYSGGGDGAECVEIASAGPHGVALREGDDPEAALSADTARVACLIRHLKDDRRRAPLRG